MSAVPLVGVRPLTPLGDGSPLTIGVVDADAPLPDLQAIEGDFLLYTRTTGRILATSIAPLAVFARAARLARRPFGFAGGLEAPDVPRLRALGPDLLAFEDAAGDRLQELIALATDPSEPGTGPLDRLFVHGLDLDLPIGAYRSEEGRTQRVRFAVEAFVRRSSAAVADTMGNVYSYDLLSDAVTIATTRDHTAFVETLAEEIAGLVLLDRRVEEVGVRIEKLDLGPAGVGVEIRRRQA